MAIPELLADLLNAPGPAGRETQPGAIWRDWCSTFATEVGVDDVGSSWARVAGNDAGPRLIVVGHIDEIGVHVTHVDDDGFVWFGLVGFWDPAVLVGQRIVLDTVNGPVAGVISRRAIHLLDAEEQKIAPKVEGLHIDIGAANGDEARSRVRIGDAGVIDVAPIEFPNGRIVSRALDNRVGCYVAARAAQLVAQIGGSAGDFVALAVTQEEVGFGGSRTSAYSHDPDVAVTVDVTHATDQPGVDLGQMTAHPFESGPVIARGTTLNPRVADLLREAAERVGIPFTIESLGHPTRSDADAIHPSRSGVPTGMVSLPLRYMHSPVEMVSLTDLEAAAKLIAAFARNLTSTTSFAR